MTEYCKACNRKRGLYRLLCVVALKAMAVFCVFPGFRTLCLYMTWDDA